MNKERIRNIELGEIDTSDYPEFTDAYIISAEYEGRKLTEYEIDELNNDTDFINQAVMKKLF